MEEEKLEGSFLENLSEETLSQPAPSEKPSTKRDDPFQSFLQKFESEETAEAKLRFSLQFMAQCVVAKSHQHLAYFWKARRLMFPLFKGNVASTIRADLWTQYAELMKEVFHLKEMLDEEATFAVEQIELAIKSLETSLDSIPELIAKEKEISFPAFHDENIKSHLKNYSEVQLELNLLNPFASRIHSLRKEVIKTEMRLSLKNRLFQRLSKAGDKVFPRRRELIEKISKEFLDDVNGFIATYFGKERRDVKNIFLIEEIKAFQEMAKKLTINTKSFGEARASLSKCWDEVQKIEKIRRAEVAQKREAQKAEEEKEAVKKKSKKEIEKKSRNEKEKFSQDLTTLLKKGGSLSLDDLKIQKDALVENYSKLTFPKAEELSFNDYFKELELLFFTKKVNEITGQIELEKISQECEIYLHSVNENVEELRKNLGRSGHDFNESLLLQELLEKAKTRQMALEKLFEEISDKLDEVRGE